MTEVLPSSATLQRLERALASGKLPDDAAKSGKRMLERMRAPVRVVLMGLPGSGKSKLFNLLAGQELILPGASIPTIELRKGPEAKTTCTLADGSTKMFPGLALRELKALNPIFVQVEAALPALEKISLLKVVATADTAEQSRAVAWAAKRADVALWCSTDFSDAEHALWAKVPDALKDHSFLVLTKADSLAEQGVLEQRIAELQPVVAEDFHSLVPIATLQAIAARRADGTLDQPLFASSGGKALITAILRQVQVGRRADMDNVDLFLARYDAFWDSADEEAQSEPDPVLEPKVEPAAEIQPALEEIAPPAPSNVTNIRPVPAPEAAKHAGADGGVAAICAGAAAHLSERARTLGDDLPAHDVDLTSYVLEHCIDTLEQIDAQISDSGIKDTILMELRDQCQEVSDTLMLMQLETADTVAADAITMLLQLKRDFETKIDPGQAEFAKKQHLSATFAT